MNVIFMEGQVITRTSVAERWNRNVEIQRRETSDVRIFLLNVIYVRIASIFSYIKGKIPKKNVGVM